MSLTVSLFVESYEKANGKKPCENTIRFIRHLDRIGREVYKELGIKDAQEGREARSEEDFMQVAMKYHSNDPEWAQILVDLAHAYYMEGYKGGAE